MNTTFASGMARYRGAVTPDADALAPAPVVALVGMMGSGKSAVAAVVATRMGWRLVDLDEVIVANDGRSIPEIFAMEGEPGFRARELAALTAVLDDPGPMVIATGGGVVTSEAAREVLRRRATVVWLDAEVSVLAERVGSGDERPMLGADPRGALEALVDARRQHYADVARVVVDSGKGDVAIVAGRVLAALGVAA